MSDVTEAVSANTQSTAPADGVAAVQPAVEAVAVAAAVADGAQAPKTDEPTTTEATTTEAAPGEEAKPVVEYALKATDGDELDPVILEAYVPIAKELGLTNEGAQKLIDTIGPVVDAQLAKMQTEMLTAFTEQNVAACIKDKEFGGDDIVKNMAVAEKALTAFGTPELRKLLEETKLNNHPEIIRAFYRAGKAISEDSFIPGGLRPPGVDDKSPGEKLYGKK